MQTIELTVAGMTCGSCVKQVEQALGSVAGIDSIAVDLAGGRVTVRGVFPEGAQPMLTALAGAGYPATLSPCPRPQERDGDQPRRGGCCH